VYCTVSLIAPVFRVGSTSILNLTTMSDSKYLNTSLLEVIITCKNQRVLMCGLSDMTLESIFDAQWASMKEGSTWLIAWNNSRHEPWWRFYLHCGIEATGSPGIICIVCHQVLRHLSQHATSSMGNHLLAKAHISMFNELIET
jgi:hypothetical protein